MHTMNSFAPAGPLSPGTEMTKEEPEENAFFMHLSDVSLLGTQVEQMSDQVQIIESAHISLPSVPRTIGLFNKGGMTDPLSVMLPASTDMENLKKEMYHPTSDCVVSSSDMCSDELLQESDWKVAELKQTWTMKPSLSEELMLPTVNLREVSGSPLHRLNSRNSLLARQESTVSTTSNSIFPAQLHDSSFVDSILAECANVNPDDCLAWIERQLEAEEVQQDTSAGVSHEHAYSRRLSDEEEPDSTVETSADHQRARCVSASSTISSLPSPVNDVNIEKVILKRRIKNNEASRKSREAKKKRFELMEEEVMSLQERNSRLKVVIEDFERITQKCKEKLVKCMASKT